MGMSAPGGSGKYPEPEVNVTPLVDIALVVLIIFMVVTPMMTKTFWLNIPRDDQDEAKKPPPKGDAPEPIVLTVRQAGVIRVNNAELSRQDLASRLPRMLAAQKRRVVYFDAKDDVPYGTAVEVMDLARASGARSIAILTKNVAK